MSQLVGAAQIGLSRDGRRALRSWKPFSVTAFSMLCALRASGVSPATIVDGGANIGQFSRAAVETFPGARVIAFEPIPAVAAVFRSNLADCDRVTLHEVALGAEDASTTIHVNAYSPASSLLHLSVESKTAFPEVVEQADVEVAVRRLDGVLEGVALAAPLLVKLDLQGFELEALRGAQRTLDQASHVLLEVSFRRLYEGEPLFDEVYQHLAARGFRFACPLAFLRDATGRTVQMDALFERVGSGGSNAA